MPLRRSLAAFAVLGAALGAPLAHAQPGDRYDDIDWVLRQQRFIVDYAASELPEPSAGRPAIRAALDAAGVAWSAHVAQDPAVPRRLTPYAVVRLLLPLFDAEDLDPAGSPACDAYAEGIVPAFLASVAAAETDPRSLGALFRASDVFYALGVLALACDLAPERWDALYRAAGRMPELGRRAAQAPPFADSLRSAELARAVRNAADHTRGLAVRQAIEAGDLEAASLGLRGLAESEYEAVFLRPLGDRLRRTALAAGDTARARAVVDLLAETLAPTVLEPATLAAWRAALGDGAADGAVARPAVLVASELRPDLGGAYLDLQTGETVDLARREPSLLLVDVWATWCVPCIAEVPVLSALAAKHAGRLRVVSVNADAVTSGGSADEVRAFMQQHGVAYPVLFDDPAHSLAERLVVRGYPAKYLVAADGTLLVAPGARTAQVNLGDVDAYLSELGGL